MTTAKAEISGKRYSFHFGREQIAFQLYFNHSKHLRINVHPDQMVTVIAPEGVSVEDVMLRVKDRAPWIIKQKNYFEQFQPLPTQRRYVSGESYYYLGRQYRLKVIKSKQRDTKLLGRYITVFTPEINNSQEIKRLLLVWYRKHAEAIYSQRLLTFTVAIRRLKIDHPEVQIRRMKKRWGSCSKSGVVLLNTELVKAPLYCIDYVIMHELCHLKIRSHNKDYFELLNKFMPDWKRRKERLEQVIL